MVEAPDRVHTFALCSLQVMRCSLVLMRKRKTTNPVALADEAGVVFLPDGHRAGAALLVDDGRRHHHVQVPGHRDHGVRVHLQQGAQETPQPSRRNLAHVVAAVLGGHVSDLQRPRVVAVVLDVEPEGKRFYISPK